MRHVVKVTAVWRPLVFTRIFDEARNATFGDLGTGRSKVLAHWCDSEAWLLVERSAFYRGVREDEATFVDPDESPYVLPALIVGDSRADATRQAVTIADVWHRLAYEIMARKLAEVGR